MPASLGTTTIEVPITLRDRIAARRSHPRQAYHEVIQAAMDALDARRRGPGADPLVERHRKALRRAAREHRLARIWLVGSRARGDAAPGADVDILFQRQAGAHAWDVAGFSADAAEILGVPVDVIDIDGASDTLRESLVQDAVVI